MASRGNGSRHQRPLHLRAQRAGRRMQVAFVWALWRWTHSADESVPRMRTAVDFVFLGNRHVQHFTGLVLSSSSTSRFRARPHLSERSCVTSERVCVPIKTSSVTGHPMPELSRKHWCGFAEVNVKIGQKSTRSSLFSARDLPGHVASSCGRGLRYLLELVPSPATPDRCCPRIGLSGPSASWIRTPALFRSTGRK